MKKNQKIQIEIEEILKKINKSYKINSLISYNFNTIILWN